MRIVFDASSLKQTRWYQVLMRFLLGGLITAATGIIGKEYGPAIGGLFLAFPAVFPASATLIEEHEKERRKQSGVHGTVRARQLVAVDAAGTAIGCIGLFVFALLAAKAFPSHRPCLVICGATLAWMAVSVLFWQIRKRM